MVDALKKLSLGVGRMFSGQMGTRTDRKGNKESFLIPCIFRSWSLVVIRMDRQLLLNLVDCDS